MADGMRHRTWHSRQMKYTCFRLPRTRAQASWWSHRPLGSTGKFFCSPTTLLSLLAHGESLRAAEDWAPMTYCPFSVCAATQSVNAGSCVASCNCPPLSQACTPTLWVTRSAAFSYAMVDTGPLPVCVNCSSDKADCPATASSLEARTTASLLEACGTHSHRLHAPSARLGVMLPWGAAISSSPSVNRSSTHCNSGSWSASLWLGLRISGR
mmetsp:Transcript_121175/g.210705  ORF Transcript_121175/g.210705 Transcript_121175/m.210705 type:complete len:211 (+) Transcript_121175:1000-1632(+)